MTVTQSGLNLGNFTLANLRDKAVELESSIPNPTRSRGATSIMLAKTIDYRMRFGGDLEDGENISTGAIRSSAVRLGLWLLSDNPRSEPCWDDNTVLYFDSTCREDVKRIGAELCDLAQWIWNADQYF